MRQRGGFTLVELVVVIGLFLLMLSAGVPVYSTWKKKQDTESQIRKLYSDLQFARMKAYSEKVVYGVWWGANNPFSSYSVRRDTNGDGVPDQDVYSVALKLPVTSKASQQNITFDGRGFATVLNSLYINSGTNAATDCVSVSRTRIMPGKWNGRTDGTFDCAAR